VDTGELNGRAVLLVDDEAFFLTTVVEGLHQAAPGLDVLTARDGITALEVLDRQPVEIVVTDIHMPRLDGFGLIAELINRESDVDVVVLTAYDRPNLREHDRLAIECLEKPLDFDQLIATLVGIIRRRANWQLRGVSLIGLLQTLEIERGAAAIRVQDNAQVVWIYIQDGRLVHAKSDVGIGLTVAAMALRWAKPRVEVHLLPHRIERTMDASITEAILDAARIEDEHAKADDFDFEPDPPIPADEPQPAAVNRVPNRKEHDMSNIKESLNKASDLSGTLGIALVDYASGMTLGTYGSGINLDVAAAGNMSVMRAKQSVMRDLGIKGKIEDILISIDTQYHIIRPVGESLFLYIALDRKSANLAMARLKLAKIAEELDID
jgi:DNA-binding response OmpR family regulator/predicted regulator of Ras-like GTPase activity (Roadblock/LC7/MglB family)